MFSYQGPPNKRAKQTSEGPLNNLDMLALVSSQATPITSNILIDLLLLVANDNEGWELVYNVYISKITLKVCICVKFKYQNDLNLLICRFY